MVISCACLTEEKKVERNIDRGNERDREDEVVLRIRKCRSRGVLQVKNTQ